MMIVLEICAVLGMLRLLWMFIVAVVGLAVTESMRGGHELAGDPGELAVGICAHNEENVIFNTVRNVREQGSVCYVMCDSCDDDTSAQVQLAGGIVLLGEYHSKGLGMLPLAARMRADGYSRLAFLDADTVVDPDWCREMSGALAQHRVVQGGLKSLNADTWVAGWMAGSTAIAQRYMEWGRTALGFSGVLCGTGWGIQARVLRKVPFVVSSVCEDLEYTLRLISAGEKVTYYPWAWVQNENVRTVAALWMQLERWARGAVQVARLETRVCLRHPELCLSVIMFPGMVVDVLLVGWIVWSHPSGLLLSAGLWSVLAVCALVMRGEAHKVRLAAMIGHPVMVCVLIACDVAGMCRWTSRRWVRTLHRGVLAEGLDSK